MTQMAINWLIGIFENGLKIVLSLRFSRNINSAQEGMVYIMKAAFLC